MRFFCQVKKMTIVSNTLSYVDPYALYIKYRTQDEQLCRVQEKARSCETVRCMR